MLIAWLHLYKVFKNRQNVIILFRIAYIIGKTITKRIFYCKYKSAATFGKEGRGCDWMGYTASAINVYFLIYSSVHLITITVKLYLCFIHFQICIYILYFTPKLVFTKVFQDSQK